MQINNTHFNMAKCKHMHVGIKTRGHTTARGGSVLASSNSEKDSGKVVDNQLNKSSQCNAGAKRIMLSLREVYFIGQSRPTLCNSTYKNTVAGVDIS